MKSLLEQTRERVLAEGPFRTWRHEQSPNQARLDLRTLEGEARAILAHCKDLQGFVGLDMRDDVRRVAFAVMQNLYPIVEAIDTDAGLYLAQAVEALRKVGADV